MIIKTKVRTEQEIEINLETPAFFKNPLSSINEYMGVINECTIEMWGVSGHSTTIKNYATEHKGSDIAEAYKSWEHISEEEFFEALDKALKDFDFKPKLITLPALTHEEQEDRDRDREEERVNDYWERELDRD